MTAWIDPNLLQLIGLGTDGDLYAPDGRHLRWFFGRLLGFPRTGFRLRRSESPLTPARWKTVATTGDVLRSQLLSEAVVGHFFHRFPNGLTVSKEGGLAYQTIEPGPDAFVRVDAKPVRLDFGHEGPADTPPSGPAATNPAAWVRLTVLRRKTTGIVAATAYANGRGTWHFQDFGAVGVGLFDVLTDLHAADRLLIDGAEVAGSLARRVGERGTMAWKHAADEEWRAVVPRPPTVSRPGLRPAPPIAAPPPNPWVADTVLLHGGLIERIEVIGRDAVVVRADWFPTRAYADAASLWSDVDRFYLPLTDAPAIYPAWTPLSGEDVAKERVMAGKPRVLPPWDEPVYPAAPPMPPGLIDNDLARRYLGVGYERMRDAMKLFLDGELTTNRPQALITVPEPLESEPPDDSFDGGAMDMYPFDLLAGASVDPHVARLLGLMTTDTTPPDGVWDYVVDAGFRSRWLLWTLLEGVSPAPIDDIGGAVVLIPGTETLRAADTRDQVCLSMATAIVRAPQPSPDPPADLRADVAPLPASRPVEAEVGLSWISNVENLFEAPQRVRVFFAVRRRDNIGTDVPIHPKDDESGALLPHVPTRSVTNAGRVAIRDTTVPRYGPFTWCVSGMDLWGRFSPFAEISRMVTDMVPPPAPAAVRGAIAGAVSAAPAWTSLQVTFDWSEGAAIAAPDVIRFDVHARQGAISPTDAESPTMWGHLELEPGATTPPLSIRWPAATIVAPPGVSGSISVSDMPAGEGGGKRIALTITPLIVPFDAAGNATIAATVCAIDAAGNVSRFARPAIVTRADLAPPPPAPPSGVLRYATRPDALGRSSFRVSCSAPSGGMVQVVRCAAPALLGAAAIDDAAFTAHDETGRVNLLQQLATTHREMFAADHEVAYSDSASSHIVALNGNDRGWTLVTTIGISRNGVREPWPSNPLRFDVVAVPKVQVPPVPIVVEARGGERRATLRIAPDPTGMSARIRIYRTRDAAASADVRRMRPVATLVASNDVAVFVDPGLFADATYFYRVEALAEDGVRSQPTSPVIVVPFTLEPPVPPEVTAVQRPADPAKRLVRWKLTRRDYEVVLLRRQHGAPWWSTAQTGASRPNGTLDLTSLVPTVDAGAYVYTIEDAVPDPAIRWTYRVRVTDPQGRVVHSPAVEEAP
jgi:hypothetical protein